MTASADRTKRHMSRQSYTTTGDMTLASGAESFNDDVVGADKGSSKNVQLQEGSKGISAYG